MNNYESVLVFSPDTHVDQIDQAISKTQELIEKTGGKSESIDKWGNKRMAYPIGKFREGFYVVMQYASESSSVQDIEKSFRLNSRIIRHLTIKLDKKALAKRIVPEIKKVEVKAHDESQVARTE